MQNIKVIRRLDELGRVVIPKEIRRTFKLRSGDALEISTDGEGVSLKKYSPVAAVTEYAFMLAEKLSSSLNKTVIVCDSDTVIATSSRASELVGNEISSELSDLILSGRTVMLNKQDGSNLFSIVKGRNVECDSQIFAPVYGDSSTGAVVVISETPCQKEDVSLVKYTAELLGERLK